MSSQSGFGVVGGPAWSVHTDSNTMRNVPFTSTETVPAGTVLVVDDYVLVTRLWVPAGVEGYAWTGGVWRVPDNGTSLAWGSAVTVASDGTYAGVAEGATGNATYFGTAASFPGKVLLALKPLF